MVRFPLLLFIMESWVAALYLGKLPTRQKDKLLFIDLSDLMSMSGPTVDRSMSLCPNCQTVCTGSDVCKEHPKDAIPFLDRRPLLLSAEMVKAISAEMTRISSSISTFDEKEREFYMNEFIPFLSIVLDESRLAFDRKKNSMKGYRETDVTPGEALVLLHDLCVLPTQSVAT